MTAPIAALVAEALEHATEVSVCMLRHDARETHGAPRFLTVADCEPDSAPTDNLCIADDADTMADANDRASPSSRVNPFTGGRTAFPARTVYARRDVFDAALAHLAARVVKAEAERDGFQDALVLARVQRAKAEGYTERALAAGEALAARAAAAEERAGRAGARANALRHEHSRIVACFPPYAGDGDPLAIAKAAIKADCDAWADGGPAVLDAAKEAGRG